MDAAAGWNPAARKAKLTKVTGQARLEPVWIIGLLAVEEFSREKAAPHPAVRCGSRPCAGQSPGDAPRPSRRPDAFLHRGFVSGGTSRGPAHAHAPCAAPPDAASGGPADRRVC